MHGDLIDGKVERFGPAPLPLVDFRFPLMNDGRS